MPLIRIDKFWLYALGACISIVLIILLIVGKFEIVIDQATDAVSGGIATSKSGIGIAKSSYDLGGKIVAGMDKVSGVIPDKVEKFTIGGIEPDENSPDDIVLFDLPEDCEIEWSEWSECNNGTRSRTGRVTHEAKNGGLACGDLIQQRDCLAKNFSQLNWLVGASVLVGELTVKQQIKVSRVIYNVADAESCKIWVKIGSSNQPIIADTIYMEGAPCTGIAHIPPALLRAGTKVKVIIASEIGSRHKVGVNENGEIAFTISE